MRSMTRRDRSQGLATTRRLVVLGVALVVVGSAAELWQTLDPGADEAGRLAAGSTSLTQGDPTASPPGVPADGAPSGAGTAPPTVPPTPTPSSTASASTAVPSATRTASASASRSASRTPPATTAPTSAPSRPGRPRPAPSSSPRPSPSEDSVIEDLMDIFGGGNRRAAP